LEVNAAPGLRMHLFPSEGQPRNVAEPIVDMLFPNSQNGRIPIIAITGTNGKTTTTRLSAHIMKQTGLVVGFTNTDGVYIDDEMVMKGDCSGPSSAQMVLKDPIVEAAVLECARGGMLRSGLGFEKPDVAIITNIDEDHLGIDHINTVEQLAHVKAVLAEAVPEYGFAVLNADDERVYEIRKRVKSNVALFSIHGYNEKITSHCAEGGIAMVRDGNNIVLIHGERRIPIDQVSNIPLAFGGHATFNIYNIMAAALANYVAGVSVELIRKGLQSFSNSPEQLPGRANMFDMLSFRVMIDYAHNPHGIRSLGQLINGMEASRKVGIIAGVGDRRNEDIIAVGHECAKIFDEVIIRHDSDLRGRTMEDLTNLLMQGIRQVKGETLVKTFTSEMDSLVHALNYAIKDSLVVILVEDPMGVIQFLKQHQQKLIGSRFKVA
jgi:cyanophycin synthetase